MNENWRPLNSVHGHKEKLFSESCRISFMCTAVRCSHSHTLCHCDV